MPNSSDPAFRRLRLWCSYFLANRLDPRESPGSTPTRSPPPSACAISKSIAQFQLGEGAQGRRLQERGRKYAEPPPSAIRISPEALALFVQRRAAP